MQADRTGESITALIDQYRHFLGDKGVTAAELRPHRSTATCASCPASFETSAAVLNALRTNALYGRPDNYWETLAAATRLTPPSWTRRRARPSTPTSFVWVVVGDAATVKPQLEGLGLPIEA